MRTAVDSSVLWCVLNQEPHFEEWKSTLRLAAIEGPLLICPVVVAEIAPKYPTSRALREELTSLPMELSPFSWESSWLAGKIHRSYRREGGPREHLIPDFLIAAHAVTEADRLAAVDRGYLRRYFPNLALLTPASI